MRPIITGLFTLTLAATAAADDWPRWRGPRYDGISTEKDWLDTWPAAGPKIAWKAKIGTGFSAVSVSQGRLFTMGNENDRDTVTCLDAVTGKKAWSHSYASPLDPNLFEGGPTATPTVDGDRVYTLSRWGHVHCYDAATGKVYWSKNVQEETNARIPSWGFGSSPLVYENLVCYCIDGAGLALEKTTGKIVWKSEAKDAGYSSPVPFQRGGETYALFSSEDAYTAVNLKTGKERWRFRWLTRYGVNATDPIVIGDQVFISTGYTKGAALFPLGVDDPKPVWQNKEMRNQFNSSVLLDGHVYGVDGDTVAKTTLKCLELKSGEPRWTYDGIGSGALMAADGKLIVLAEDGELIVAKASPDGFKPSAKAKVLDGKCWTMPVLANGRIYCRNADGDLVCVDVRKP